MALPGPLLEPLGLVGIGARILSGGRATTTRNSAGKTTNRSSAADDSRSTKFDIATQELMDSDPMLIVFDLSLFPSTKESTTRQKIIRAEAAEKPNIRSMLWRWLVRIRF